MYSASNHNISQHESDDWHRQDNEEFGGWRELGLRGGWQQGHQQQQRQSRGSHHSFAGAAEPNIRDSFLVLHFKKYEGYAPPLNPPTVLGSFSVDNSLNILFDNSMMPVLSRKYTPDAETMKVDMDLNRCWHRINNFTGTSADGFKNLLQWFLRNQDKVRVSDGSDRLAADFVCSRRLLKQIMQAPYAHEKHNAAEWVLLAEYFKGTIYLTNEVPEHDKCKSEGISLMEIYGHKFEQYMTGGDPDDVLEGNCQYRCVLQLHLNETTLLYAPDTDAVDLTRHKDNFTDMSSFVRLKALGNSSNPNADYNYRKYILNNWWIENKLTGVPRLLVGKRNPEGVVHTLQMLQTDDFPNMAQGVWKPSVCINVLDKFLDFVKRRVEAEPDVVHRFEKSIESLRNIRHSCDPSWNDILPSWYKENLFAT